MSAEPLIYWHWFIACVVLLVLEALLPGFFFMWMGIAAGVTGVVVLALPGIEWQIQVILFAVLSVLSVVLGRMSQPPPPTVTAHPAPNRRAQQYVGRRFPLDEPIVNGYGKLRVGDSVWSVSGSDLPAGTQVTVTGTSGVVLLVEKV